MGWKAEGAVGAGTVHLGVDVDHDVHADERARDGDGDARDHRRPEKAQGVEEVAHADAARGSDGAVSPAVARIMRCPSATTLRTGQP